MIIAVASGKGGTGKTTVSVNLARAFGSAIQLLDCDVEEPNAHLFLRGSPITRQTVMIRVPQVDESLCDGCGLCSRLCEYHAIVSFGAGPIVFADMCHGCGGCALVCPQRAIREVDRRLGVVETIQAGNVTLVQGRIDVGVPLTPPLVRAVKAHLRNDTPALLDGPPGTSCPVVTTLHRSDFVLLVTEPTPFGLHDLTLAVAMVDQLGIPCGVVLNRVGVGDDRVHRFCAAKRIPILLEIPDDRRIAEAYSRGSLIVDTLPEYRSVFKGLMEKILLQKELLPGRQKNSRGVRDGYAGVLR